MRDDIIAILDYFKPKLELWRKKEALSGFHIAPDIPNKKLQNATSKYGEGIRPEQVILLNDTSLSGSGKEGFIFAREAIVGRKDWENFRFEVSEVRSLSISGVARLVVNGKNIGPLAGKREAAEKALRMIRALCFAIKATKPFESPEFAARAAEYLSEHEYIGGLAFAHVDESQWYCTCGTSNELDRSAGDQECSSCVNSRNYQLIYGSKNLVAKALRHGTITPDDVIAEFGWLSKTQVDAVFTTVQKEMRFDIGFLTGCLVFSLILAAVGIGLLVFRPPYWGIPGVVCVIIAAIGVSGIAAAWKGICACQKTVEVVEKQREGTIEQMNSDD